jgi:hypothetical protein
LGAPKSSRMIARMMIRWKPVRLPSMRSSSRDG